MFHLPFQTLSGSSMVVLLILDLTLQLLNCLLQLIYFLQLD